MVRRKLIYNDFEAYAKVECVACDTETYTLIDNVKVNTDELIKLGKEHNVAWFRKHTKIDTYAWIVSDGKHTAICSDFDEWCDFICEHKIKCCWWYNAKFDFANIDYEVLSRGWTINDEDGGKNQANTYSSLHSDKGARYSYKLWYAFRGKGRNATDRHKRVHSWVNVDFCNIFGGGLKANLKAFNVVDFDGNKLDKLEMDYQNNTNADGSFTAEAIDYMKLDAIGLYHLVRIADTFMQENFKLNLLCDNPAVITAGGLAKRQLLEHLYHLAYKENRLMFKCMAQIDLELDAKARDCKLYEGGICTINQRYQNRLYKGLFYRYDINSMYPHKMAYMSVLRGKPKVYSYAQYLKLENKLQDKVIIFNLQSYSAILKANMIPVMRDYDTNDFSDCITFISQEAGFTKMFYKSELDELMNWYDINFIVKDVWVFDTTDKLVGYNDFVMKFYSLKNKSKKDGNKVLNMFSKLLLNSSYGKLAERPARIKCHREISADTGAVHLVNDGVEVDASTLLSVYQGALITSNARVQLLQLIRYTCKNVAREFIYCDTDSIHITTMYDKADDFKLGELKLEATCNYGKWLAPKTYFEAGTDSVVELHSKGIPTKVIIEHCVDAGGLEYNKEKKIATLKDIKVLDEAYSTSVKYQCLSGMNVVGGKALIPLEKYLCQESNTIKFNIAGDEEIIENEMER